jgi:transcriptional regulator with XRE-family HTH domain
MKCPRCGGTGEIPDELFHFGDLLRMQRDRAGMTQLELANLAGIGRAQIANLETGRGDPSLVTLRKLAKALGCSPKDLVV